MRVNGSLVWKGLDEAIGNTVLPASVIANDLRM